MAFSAGITKPAFIIHVAQLVKMPKIDTLDALDDEMTSILNTLCTPPEHT